MDYYGLLMTFIYTSYEHFLYIHIYIYIFSSCLFPRFQLLNPFGFLQRRAYFPWRSSAARSVDVHHYHWAILGSQLNKYQSKDSCNDLLHVFVPDPVDSSHQKYDNFGFLKIKWWHRSLICTHFICLGFVMISTSLEHPLSSTGSVES